MEKVRSTMTLTELSQRREECQGPVFRTRFEFIRYVIDACLSELSNKANIKNLRYLVERDRESQSSLTTTDKNSSSLYTNIFGNSVEDDDGISDIDTEGEEEGEGGDEVCEIIVVETDNEYTQ